MKNATPHIGRISLREPLFRGKRRLRIALVGLPNSGKSTFFASVASTSVQSGALAGTHRAYDECAVQIGLDEARVIDLPSIRSPHHLESDDRAALKYLLWGDERPPISLHEPDGPPAPFAPPDVIVQVVDATALEHHLELTLKLVKFGRPLVIALNKMDEAGGHGIYVNARELSSRLGVPVVPTVALIGQGIAELFRAAVGAVREGVCPVAQPPSRHICRRPRAARSVAERGRDPAGVPRADATARDADCGRRSVLYRRNAAALSRLSAGSGAAARESRSGVAPPVGGRIARGPPPPRGHALRSGDPARRAERGPRLALLAGSIVPEFALGLCRQRGGVRRGAVRRVLCQRMDRQRDFRAAGDLGFGMAAGIDRRRGRDARWWTA